MQNPRRFTPEGSGLGQLFPGRNQGGMKNKDAGEYTN